MCAPVYAPSWFVEKEDLPVLVLVIVKVVCVRESRRESGERKEERSTAERNETTERLRFYWPRWGLRYVNEWLIYSHMQLRRGKYKVTLVVPRSGAMIQRNEMFIVRPL